MHLLVWILDMEEIVMQLAGIVLYKVKSWHALFVISE